MISKLLTDLKEVNQKLISLFAIIYRRVSYSYSQYLLISFNHEDAIIFGLLIFFWSTYKRLSALDLRGFLICSNLYENAEDIIHAGDYLFIVFVLDKHPNEGLKEFPI